MALDIFLQYVFRSLNLGLANRGVSFGLGQGIGNVLSIVALGFICIYLYRPAYTGMTLILLGGVGNVLARLIWGSVWDYICLPFLPFCFNLSDVLISLGVVSYILMGNGNRDSLRRQRHAGNKQAGGIGGE